MHKKTSNEGKDATREDDFPTPAAPANATDALRVRHEAAVDVERAASMAAAELRTPTHRG